MSAPDYARDPKRFEVAPITLFIDRFMNGFIKIGGGLVIAAVLGIFVFIFLQIFPLFQSARVEEIKTFQLPTANYAAMGVDEWGDKPFALQSNGDLVFADLESGKVLPADISYESEKQISAVFYNERQQQIAIGTTDGHFGLIKLNYTATDDGTGRQVRANPTADAFIAIGREGMPIQAVAFGDADERKVVAAVQEFEGRRELHVVTLTRKRSLLGTSEAKIDKVFDLTPKLTGQPVQILVPTTGDSVVVLNSDGSVNYLFLNRANEFELRQVFIPFEDLADRTVSSMNFLLGDVSVVFASVTGENRIFSLYIPRDENTRVFGLRHQFPALPSAPVFITGSLRNKAFLLGGGNFVSLRYSTTDTIRWESPVSFTVKDGVINGKYDRIIFLDTNSMLHVYDLHDDHPESGWRSLFGKLYYEGATEKKWEWQSTGGSDDFEPKLSLVPLIFGTLKGTLYAMLFAVPIALLAALYTSQFMDPGYRSIIKPAMEIMASLPSVVLGFLAAIYIAPILERQVPSLLLLAGGLPILAVVIGWGWSSMPIQIRRRIPNGYEGFVFIPLLLVFGAILWNLGPLFERLVFTTVDPSTGQKIADFRYWWPAVTGSSFEQRNSLVVGFMMGFAVIPIIFTITDDALSNVPPALRSGSLALGASRWQTAMRVVVPTASAGIFSAIMIGLGRAVGETMIVVMATGNTPIMEWNIFSGMRTLSANIAVELPEAPQFSTLYRTLFLGAMALFILTFAVNTVAEVLRQHLRERFKTV